MGASIPSSDGSEIYVFDSSGKHLETKYARTGRSKYIFEYDIDNYLIGIQDAFANKTQIHRSGALPTSIESPYGEITNLSVSPDGYLTSASNPNNESFVMTYYSGGLLSSFKNPRNAISGFTYDAKGLLIKDANAEGGFLSLSGLLGYDGFDVQVQTAEGRMTQVTSQTVSGVTTARSYDEAHLFTETKINTDNSVVVLDPNQVTIRTTNKGDPRLSGSVTFPGTMTHILPSGLTRQQSSTRSVASTPGNIFEYTEANTTNINGRIYSGSYSSATKIESFTSPEGRQISSLIDDQERPLSISVTGLNSVNLGYDPRGRLSEVVSDVRRTSFTYDNKGRVAAVTDPLNRTSGYDYDNSDRVTRRTLPDSRVIDFAYDSAGNLTSLMPSGRPAHQFTYNLINDVMSYLPPSLSSVSNVTTQYAYNLDRQVTRITRPDGGVINLNYDPVKSYLNSISTPGGNYGFSYSAITGNPIATQSPDLVVSQYTYDGSLLTSEVLSGAVSGSASYSYNNDFKISSVTVANIPVGISYNIDNMVSQIGGETFSYKAENSLLESMTLGPMTDSYMYNLFGEVTDYLAARNSTELMRTAITRDNGGRIQSKSERLLGVPMDSSYLYDLQGRLINANNNGVVNSYTYDGNGNRLSATLNGSSVSATYDNQDRLLSYGPSTYGYNANGERVTKIDGSGTTSYAYDSFGNLKSVTLPNGTVLSYLLDSRMRRVGVKVNGILQKQFIYQNQLQIGAELDGSGNLVARYVYGSKSNVPDYMIKGGVTYKLVSDQVGSVRLVVNAATGAVAQRMDYDEFGVVLADSSPGFQLFGFAGGLYDQSTKLVHFGRRDYDAEVGRWLSKDPILFAGGDTNLFGYVMNDPINFIDPTGLYWFRQGWQTPGEVGRVGSIVPPAPAGQISDFIEGYVPAGYTFGQNHDGFVDWATSRGVPDWLANIPSMIPLYGYSVGQEALRSLGIINQPTPSNGQMCK